MAVDASKAFAQRVGALSPLSEAAEERARAFAQKALPDGLLEHPRAVLDAAATALCAPSRPIEAKTDVGDTWLFEALDKFHPSSGHTPHTQRPPESVRDHSFFL